MIKYLQYLQEYMYRAKDVQTSPDPPNMNIYENRKDK